MLEQFYWPELPNVLYNQEDNQGEDQKHNTSQDWYMLPMFANQLQ